MPDQQDSQNALENTRISRRTLTKGAVWSLPVVSLATTTPAFAQSPSQFAIWDCSGCPPGTAGNDVVHYLVFFPGVTVGGYGPGVYIPSPGLPPTPVRVQFSASSAGPWTEAQAYRSMNVATSPYGSGLMVELSPANTTPVAGSWYRVSVDNGTTWSTMQLEASTTGSCDIVPNWQFICCTEFLQPFGNACKLPGNSQDPDYKGYQFWMVARNPFATPIYIVITDFLVNGVRVPSFLSVRDHRTTAAWLHKFPDADSSPVPPGCSAANYPATYPRPCNWPGTADGLAGDYLCGFSPSAATTPRYFGQSVVLYPGPVASICIPGNTPTFVFRLIGQQFKNSANATLDITYDVYEPDIDHDGNLKESNDCVLKYSGLWQGITVASTTPLQGSQCTEPCAPPATAGTGACPPSGQCYKYQYNWIYSATNAENIENLMVLWNASTTTEQQKWTNECQASDPVNFPAGQVLNPTDCSTAFKSNGQGPNRDCCPTPDWWQGTGTAPDCTEVTEGLAGPAGFEDSLTTFPAPGCIAVTTSLGAGTCTTAGGGFANGDWLQFTIDNTVAGTCPDCYLADFYMSFYPAGAIKTGGTPTTVSFGGSEKYTSVRFQRESSGELLFPVYIKGWVLCGKTNDGNTPTTTQCVTNPPGIGSTKVVTF